MKIVVQNRKVSKTSGEKMRRVEYELATLLFVIAGVTLIMGLCRSMFLFLGDAHGSINGQSVTILQLTLQ